MTGRGFGYCAGYSVPGFTSPTGAGMGRGMARGRGGGRGRGVAMRRGRGACAGFVPPFAAAPDEETVLKSQLSALKDQLAAIKARLGEIGEEKASE